jgi:1-deoxy-D-xylulose-5-phosphate synthase
LTCYGSSGLTHHFYPDLPNSCSIGIAERREGLNMPDILNNLALPEGLRQLNQAQRLQLAAEVRDLIIRTVSQNGGHLASNLGVVELTMALLIEFDFRRDRIIFDVGHQAYTWKILTGRCGNFCTLRQKGGLAGFPKREESPFDFFNTGHSSTSISAALGLSRAMNRLGRAGHVIALVGDGALTGGMAFEAMTDAGQSGENLIIILNDNQMSIGRNVGGLSRHLENLRISPHYIRIRSRLDAFLMKIPLLGRPISQMIRFFKMAARMAIQQQGIFFEQLGFRYYGPIDGHDLPGLLYHLKAIQELKGPVLLHVLTQKGRGYRYAEESPDLYHGVAPFVIENGISNGSCVSPDPAAKPASFSTAFGSLLKVKAAQDPRICAISAAMTTGTGLGGFASSFPGRFFDVGIAEQHAMTLAAGLASGGMRPVVALYSTFLQRAVDQLLHDICLQNLAVTLAIDRAGIVGEDGDTHQGLYDLGLLLPLPNLEIFCPPDYRTLAQILDYALQAANPVAIRYPRGCEVRVMDAGITAAPRPDLTPIKQAVCLREGSQITLVALGTLAEQACAAADCLLQEGISAEVLLVVCAKPLDKDAILQSATKTGRLMVIEEALASGGIGQAILPLFLAAPCSPRFLLHSIPSQLVGQGSRSQLLADLGLTADGIAAAARKWLTETAFYCESFDSPDAQPTGIGYNR